MSEIAEGSNAYIVYGTLCAYPPREIDEFGAKL